MHIVLGLIIAFAIVLLVARGRKTTRQCRWRRDKSGDRGNLSKYRCAFCGEEAFTATADAPNKCLRKNSKS